MENLEAFMNWLTSSAMSWAALSFLWLAACSVAIPLGKLMLKSASESSKTGASGSPSGDTDSRTGRFGLSTGRFAWKSGNAPSGLATKAEAKRA